VRNIFKKEYFIKNSLVFEKKKGPKKGIKNQQTHPPNRHFVEIFSKKNILLKILIFREKKGKKRN
jgi:hypothetical protein